MAKTNGSSDPINPEAYQRIVGSTFTKAEHKPLITIGNRSWSKWELGRIGCPHPAAATRVARMIQQQQITTTKEFLERAHEFGRYKSMGVTCYWTVLALARDIGADIESVHGSDKSFLAIHTKALRDNTAIKPRRRRRRY